MTCDTWHVTPDTWHLTHSVGLTFSQNSSSLALLVWDWQWIEDIWTKGCVTEWMNESMNHKPVYRTAPATLGLLITHQNLQFMVRPFCWVVIKKNYNINMMISFLISVEIQRFLKTSTETLDTAWTKFETLYSTCFLLGVAPLFYEDLVSPDGLAEAASAVARQCGRGLASLAGGLGPLASSVPGALGGWG